MTTPPKLDNTKKEERLSQEQLQENNRGDHYNQKFRYTYQQGQTEHNKQQQIL